MKPILIELVYNDMNFHGPEITRFKKITWPHPTIPTTGDIIRVDDFLDENDYAIEGYEIESLTVDYVAWEKDLISIFLE